MIDANYRIVLECIENFHSDWKSKTKWYPHHDCHAISSIIPSKFQQTNYITADGFGDTNAGVYGYFDGEKLRHFGEIDSVKSLGGYYSWITNFLGFRRNSEEGKTMGLASYGTPNFDLLPEFSIHHEDGLIECDVY